jgi:hypothetical protein
LPVVLYGYETWSITLTEERRLRVFENCGLRRIFGPKRDEVTRSGENYIVRISMICTPREILCTVRDQIENEIGGACSTYEEGALYRLLVAKPERKRPFGRPRRRWEDNIKTDLHEVGCGGMDWIKLAQNRDRWRELLNTVMNIRVP